MNALEGVRGWCVGLREWRGEMRRMTTRARAGDGAGAGAGAGAGGGGSRSNGGSGSNGNSGGWGSNGNNEGSGESLNAWAMYLRALEKNPLATKCATSGFINALGDLFAQFMFDDAATKGVDYRRVGIFTFLGAALVGPALHFWYGALGKLVTVKGSVGAAISLILDQGLFAPVFMCVFLSSLFTIEGMQDKIVPKLKQDFVPTVVANWQIWIPFQFFNFRFVPLNLQVAAANVVALLWNVYLSWASHKRVVEVAAPAPAGKKGQKVEVAPAKKANKK